jgi:hypothetical protein
MSVRGWLLVVGIVLMATGVSILGITGGQSLGQWGGLMGMIGFLIMVASALVISKSERKKPAVLICHGLVCALIAYPCFYSWALWLFGGLYLAVACDICLTLFRTGGRFQKWSVLLFLFVAGVPGWHIARCYGVVGIDGNEWAGYKFKPEVRKEVRDVRRYVFPPFGPCPDSEELVRFVAPPGVIAEMAKKYSLQRIGQGKEGEVPELKHFWEKPPYWWKPNQSNSIIYYCSAPSCAIILAYDESNNLAYWKK